MNKHINQSGIKLIPHLHKQENYAIYYRKLKYLAELGFMITTEQSHLIQTKGLVDTLNQGQQREETDSQVRL